MEHHNQSVKIMFYKRAKILTCCVLVVLSYAKNIGIIEAISSGNLEELDIIWQPQIKESLRSFLNLL